MQGFPVTLIEREMFPRHKLCGEFISPECFPHFAVLGVLDEMMAGGSRIAETRFYSAGGASVSVPSDWFGPGNSALGLSRAAMDFRLMNRAQATGVEVIEGASVTGLIFERGEVAGLKIRHRGGMPAEMRGRLFIDATGRASILSKLAAKQGNEKLPESKNGTAKYVGFKAHLSGASPADATCEIYSFRDGYGGLSRIESGMANFCFLIKASAVRELDGDVNNILEEIVFANKRAHRTLRDAVHDAEWLKVTIQSFGKRTQVPAANLFSIGDSAAFIDPFTGSGMLMALESSEVLADCITRHYGELETIARVYREDYARRFNRRLRISSALRRAAFTPRLARGLISAVNVNSRVRQYIARSTRGKIGK